MPGRETRRMSSLFCESGLDREEAVAGRFGLDDLAVDLDADDDAEKAVTIAAAAFGKDGLLGVEWISPRTAGIVVRTSSATPAGGDRGIVTPVLKHHFLGGE
jgi:hypothetical protein